MLISELNWMQVEDLLAHENRCVIPIGSTEQHAQLSLSTDTILAERVSVEAAKPLGVPVFPALPYGVTPGFSAFPGTISLKLSTFLEMVSDVVRSAHRSGFRRIIIVNAHGGNAPLNQIAQELMGDLSQCSIKVHHWWQAPKTWSKVQEIDPSGSHANWMENFPWTRLEDSTSPAGIKEQVDLNRLRSSPPVGARQLLGDGSFGGRWQYNDELMHALWAVGVNETRDALIGPWPE